MKRRDFFKIVFTIFLLFTTTAPANMTACADWTYWLPRWASHIGTLPNALFTTNNTTRIWSVTANLGGGATTVSGVGWCSTSASTSLPPSGHVPTGRACWCRITEPRLGPWIFLVDYSNTFQCEINCPNLCSARCIITGTDRGCTRAAILN